MSATPFFTEEMLEKIATKFADLFEKEPKLPLSPRTVNLIMQKHLGENRIIRSFMAQCPRLPNIIDTKCRVRFGRIAPVLKALGKSFARSADGQITGPSEEWRPGKEEPKLGDSKTNGHTNGHANGHANGNGNIAAMATRLENATPEEKAPERKGRIFWNQEARDLLHAGVMERFQRHPERGITIETFTKAMHDCLPTELQRPALNSIAAIGQETWDKAVEEAQLLVRKALLPPPPPVEVEKLVQVELPVDIEAVLRTYPLPRLIGIVAEREAEMRLGSYGPPVARPAQAAIAPARAAEPAPQRAAPQVPLPMDFSEIEAAMPHVQILGFNAFEDKKTRELFKFLPVVLLPTIITTEKLDARLLAGDCLYYVNVKGCSDEWREFLRSKSNPTTRRTYTDPEKVRHHIKELGDGWAGKHPILFQEWKKLRPLSA